MVARDRVRFAADLVRRLALVVCTAGLIAVSPPSIQAESVRVALVGSRDVQPADGVVAYAEAKLSALDDVAVLDRKQIGRVLAEQKLSVAGLVHAETVVKASKLLAVDLFVLIEQSADGKEALACIVYDTATGVRLCDTS